MKVREKIESEYYESKLLYYGSDWFTEKLNEWKESATVKVRFIF